MSDPKKLRLPETNVPLSKEARECGEFLAYWAEARYELRSTEEANFPPAISAINSKGEMEAHVFQTWNPRIKEIAGALLAMLERAGRATSFVCSGWMSVGAKELIEGSGVIMPPRVDPKRIECVLLQIRANSRRLALCAPIEQGKPGAYKIVGDTADGQHLQFTNFEPGGAGLDLAARAPGQ